MSLVKRALQPAVNALWRAVQNKKAPAPQQRSFDAAQATRLLASWGRDAKSINKQLETELRPLRARSRNLCQNNEYAKNFIAQVKSNVIGPDGIRLQVKSRNTDGTLDYLSNNAVESSWKESGKTRQFEVTRRFDRATFERLLAETVARDGEALVQRIKGFDNKSRYALRFIDVDYLDETYNTEKDLNTGNRVRMGVEIDSYGAPVGYHLRTKHPGESYSAGARYERYRVDVSEIYHIFIPMFADQWRGIPWMHASMIGLRDLGGYREAALIAARVGAAKMGFLSSPAGDGYTGDGLDAEGNTIMEAEAGTFDQVPAGTTLLNWDPQYPHGDFEPFNKALLKGISVGFGMSYHKSSGDLEGVNYSSGRLGELSERDMWMMVQNCIIGQFHELIYPDWLSMQLLAGNIVDNKGRVLPPEAFTRLLKIQWQPRRWKWTDPQKEFNGIKGEIDEALISRSQAMRDRGHDPEEVWLEIQQENALLKSLGITPGADGFIQIDPDTDDDTDDDNNGEDNEKKPS